MYYNNALMMAINDQPVYMLPQMAARHGLITGATGTGKTVTVKVMAEAFSDAGVPVFLSDIKGDLAGMSVPGQASESIQSRIDNFGLASYGWNFSSYPTVYWDVFAKKGVPVRATISEMGPLLLSRLMDLSDAQEGVLNIIFKIADDQGLLLMDLKDLRAVVQAVGDHAADYKTAYGNIASASIGAIQRGLLKLQTQGADMFFGEPALDIMDWLRCDQNGKGVINVLNCEELFQKPDLYTAFLLWMLSELYETLPEVGDLDKPRIVFFFDEAHLLFKLKSKELMEKVEQVIRLIRSKGVGVYFITQNPADVPDTVLSQLGNKIQHALRAYTPTDQKAVKAAARSFAINPAFKTEDVIPQLGKGEALVSFLDEKGAPSMVQRATILPPQSLMGTIDDTVLVPLILGSDMYQKYSQVFDRQSAYEMLNGIMPQANTLQSAGEPYMYAQAQPYGAVHMQQAATADESWRCPVCGNINTTNFCGNCGNARPQAAPVPQDVQPQSGNIFMQNIQQPETVNMTEQLLQKKAMEQAAAQGMIMPEQTAYQQPDVQQTMYQQPIQSYQQQYPSYGQQAIGGSYQGPSLVASVQAQQAAQAAQTQTYTQAQIEKMQKEAVKQAKAELKAEQEANKESDLAKSAKSIATSGARTAVNYLVRGALGTLLKKK